ncbi:hypothetical protein BDL97_12G095900 [Sphagnum fallax]|nr:hypothetical protein BDL97_12G095900 [Sphagnum fallax]
MKTGEGNVGGGDGSNNTTATAAKVAAEVAPNVVTGGIVAETGPRPDFSLWTVEDDLLLKNAVEVGAAMEALAKGAMRFSRKFTVRELRERWRALLYDPEIAAQAASRMVEAEAALSNLPPNTKTLNEHRNTKVLARKRRARSIRSLYYKKRKRMAAEKLVAAVMLENELESDFMTGDEMAEDIVHGEQGGALQPILPSGLEDKSLPGGLLSPKEPTTDFEEPTFSEMVSLLAAGGVGAVIKAMPAVMVMDNAIDAEHKVLGGISGNRGTLSGHAKLLKIEASQPDEKIVLGSKLVSECLESRHAQESVVVIPTPEVRVVLPSETGIAEGAGATVGADLQLHHSSKPEEIVEQLQLVQKIERDLVGNHTLDSTSKDYISQQKGARVNTDLVNECDRKPPNPSFLSATHHGQGDETQLPDPVNAGPNIPKNIQETDPASDVIRIEQPRIQVAEEDGITFNPEDPLHNNDPTCKSAVTVKEQLNISGELSDISSRLLNTKCAPSKAKTEAEIATPPSCPETIEEDKLASESMVEKLEDTDNGCSGQQEGMVEEKGDVELNTSSHDEDFSMSVPDDELLHHDSPMLDVDYCDPEDATDHIHNQPVGLGSIICILNMQDTEIPILDEALPLPVWAMPPSPSEEVDEEEEDDIYHMEQTTPTDATMASRSPGMFYDLEEMSNPAPEEENLWDHGEAADNHDLLYRHSDHASPPNAPVMDQVLSSCRMSEQRLEEDDKEIEDDKEEGEEEEEAEEEDEEEEKGISCSGTQLPQIGTLELGEHCSNFGILQKIPPSGPGIVLSLPQYTTEHTTRLATEAENFPSDFDPSTCQEVLAGVGASREVSSCREDTDHLLIEEEEPESEAEMARFSDVETMIINMDLDPGVDDEFSARAESRQMYRQQRRTLLRLEQGVGAAMQRNLTNQKALAILYGRHLRYYITKTKVLMGRGTHDNAVDIDLWKEGRANKVSRQQASLKLKEDGVFYLRNLGRRSLTVNNNAVETGQRAILGSNCLIEVGGMRFIFEINKRLVKQQVEQMRVQTS